MLDEWLHACLNRTHLLHNFCQRLCAGRLLTAQNREEEKLNLNSLGKAKPSTYPLFSPFDADSAVFELLVFSLDDDDCECDVVPVAVDSDDVVAAAEAVAALVFETFIEIGL